MPGFLCVDRGEALLLFLRSVPFDQPTLNLFETLVYQALED